MFPNSSEDPSPLHSRTHRLAHPIPYTGVYHTRTHLSLPAGWLFPRLGRGPSSPARVYGAYTCTRRHNPTTALPSRPFCSTPRHTQADRYTTMQPPSRRFVHTGVNTDTLRIHSLPAVTGVLTGRYEPTALSTVGHLQAHNTQKSNTPMSKYTHTHAPCVHS